MFQGFALLKEIITFNGASMMKIAELINIHILPEIVLVPAHLMVLDVQCKLMMQMQTIVNVKLEQKDLILVGEIANCCGDDANEYKITCIGDVGACSGDNVACCNAASDCVYNNVCYSTGASLNGFVCG